MKTGERKIASKTTALLMVIASLIIVAQLLTGVVAYAYAKLPFYMHFTDDRSLSISYKLSLSSNASLEIPEHIIFIKVTHLDENAFLDCDEFTEIILPETLTHIGAGAFRGCVNLKHIEIPNSVTHIGKAAFVGCDSLKSIYISENVVNIGDNCFNNDIVIYGRCNSYAEEYAKENGYTFIEA